MLSSATVVLTAALLAPAAPPVPIANEAPPRRTVTLAEARVQFGMGISLTVLAAGLWAGGGLAIHRGIERRSWCAVNTPTLAGGLAGEPPLACLIDAPALAFAAGALSFVFAIPATIGGAIVTERAVKHHRRARRLRLTGSPGGFVLRF